METKSSYLTFAYIKFRDPVFLSGWTDEVISYDDGLHSGVGVLLDEDKHSVTVAFFARKGSSYVFTKLRLSRKVIQRIVTFSENIFYNGLLTEGYGKIGGDEKDAIQK